MKPLNSKPRRSKTDKRTCRLAISVTPEEKKRIEEQASDANLKMSEFIYCAVMSKKVVGSEFRKDIKSLASIANSLNQIAKAGNKYGFLSAENQQALITAVTDIYKTINSKI